MIGRARLQADSAPGSVAVLPRRAACDSANAAQSSGQLGGRFSRAVQPGAADVFKRLLVLADERGVDVLIANTGECDWRGRCTWTVFGIHIELDERLHGWDLVKVLTHELGHAMGVLRGWRFGRCRSVRNAGMLADEKWARRFVYVLAWVMGWLVEVDVCRE